MILKLIKALWAATLANRRSFIRPWETFDLPLFWEEHDVSMYETSIFLFNNQYFRINVGLSIFQVSNDKWMFVSIYSTAIRILASLTPRPSHRIFGSQWNGNPAHLMSLGRPGSWWLITSNHPPVWGPPDTNYACRLLAGVPQISVKTENRGSFPWQWISPEKLKMIKIHFQEYIILSLVVVI